jgi:hypothetical protein
VSGASLAGSYTRGITFDAMTTSRIARYAVGEQVTVLVGSKAGEHASIEHVVWSARDRCHYFYLEQPGRKLSRGYRADELADGTGDSLGE